MAVRKKALFFMVSILLLLIFLGMPSVKSSETSNVVIRRFLIDGRGFSIQDIATKADMYMNHFEQGWKIPKIHALNPRVICLLYRNIRCVYEYSAEYETFVKNGWILKDPYGVPIHFTKFPENWLVDVGNPACQQWVANWIKRYLDQYGYDGVNLDNCLPGTEDLGRYTPLPPINPRTGKPWTDEEFKQAMIAQVNKIKDTIGSKLVIGNSIWNGRIFFGTRNQGYVALLTQSKIDGVESEAWIMDRDKKTWYSEDNWLASIKLVVWLENNFLNRGAAKMFLPFAQNAAPYNGQSESLPYGCTKEQYALYSFASLLLGASSPKHYLNFGWYVDYYPQSLFKIGLGSPLGAYYMVSGTHVYTRDFTEVKVLVNPTDQSYSINLVGSYQNLDGTPAKSPLTVPPHTGKILKKVKNPVVFQSGFESGSLSGWVLSTTKGDTLTISTEKTHQGQYALKARTDGVLSGSKGEMAYATYYLGSAPSSLYVRVYAMFSTLPTIGNTFNPLNLRATAEPAAGSVAFVYIANVKGVTTWRLCHINGYSNVYKGTTSIVQAQKWYSVEVYVNVHSTAGAVTLWINGVQLYRVTNINTAAYGTVKYFQVGERWSSNAVPHSTYIDDIVVSSSYIGP